MAGRPTKYTKKLGDAICVQLAGGDSLRSICSQAKMPALSTVLLWVVDGKHNEFSEQYHVAREAAGYAHADQILDAVEKAGNGTYDPNQARAVMDGLKWAAERMSPKKHSPRQQIDHASPDGSMTPQPTRIELVAPGDNSKG